MDNSSVDAKGILLTQIKQDFVTPANAIFDYLDIVEKAVSKLDLQSDDELNQIKSSCNKFAMCCELRKSNLVTSKIAPAF